MTDLVVETWPPGSLVTERLALRGASLWIPCLGGRFDPENTVHGMATTITSGLSKGERQHAPRRVRAAMAILATKCPLVPGSLGLPGRSWLW
ncbi:MAG: hypothetical protein QOH50_4769 [Kribbellaceae bacterium]|nr:hypothetical protein [Kribbellaceae bacterium]